MAMASGRPVDLSFDTFGNPADPPLVMFGGFANQVVAFDPNRCAELAGKGVRVVRVDLRDCGNSTHLEPDAAYTLTDMAEDVVGLIRQLGYGSVHLMGVALGASLAQIIAHDHRDLVRSLVMVAAQSGEHEYGRPSRAVLERFNSVLSGAHDADVMTLRLADLLLAIDNGGGLDPAEALAISAEIISRDVVWNSAGRVFGAMLASPPRADLLRAITQPTLVIHGNRDPLVAISGGRRVAALIRHSMFLEVDGMGHYLSRVFWDAATAVIADHVLSAERITSG